jgi:hypothetical protein
MIKEGDKFRSTFTGVVYRVKRTKDAMLLLETENESSQVVMNRSSIKLFYQDEGKKGDKGVFFAPQTATMD